MPVMTSESPRLKFRQSLRGMAGVPLTRFPTVPPPRSPQRDPGPEGEGGGGGAFSSCLVGCGLTVCQWSSADLPIPVCPAIF